MLGYLSSTGKTGCAGHTCDPSSLEVDWKVKVIPWLDSELETSLGYMGPWREGSRDKFSNFSPCLGPLTACGNFQVFEEKCNPRKNSKELVYMVV